MFQKHTDMGKWWRNDNEQENYKQESVSKNKGTLFNFNQIDSVDLFTESHLQVMNERVELADWKTDIDVSVKHFTSTKQKLFYWMLKKI